MVKRKATSIRKNKSFTSGKSDRFCSFGKGYRKGKTLTLPAPPEDYESEELIENKTNTQR
ncbi:hypothetical protein [Pontibacter ruber]|uniref:Uncharacterized protein n=1 Tax=Pontibacter ruber TaxID=1343895 RepID=A0ABW5D3B0_9BACT|nr:hypothetical protein [Pontibacter ruber]